MKTTHDHYALDKEDLVSLQQQHAGFYADQRDIVSRLVGCALRLHDQVDAAAHDKGKLQRKTEILDSMEATIERWRTGLYRNHKLVQAFVDDLTQQRPQP